MSQRDAWTELDDLRKKARKAQIRSQSEHSKDLHPLTAYTHLFDPMGDLTTFLGRGHAFKNWVMLARDPEIRAYAEFVADLHIYELEMHMARWQGQDQIMVDDDMIAGRRILYQEGAGYRSVTGGLDGYPRAEKVDE